MEHRIKIALIWIALARTAAFAQTTQRSFPTPQEAAQALVDAAEHNDTAAMLKLFGPDGRDIVESGDAAEDQSSRAEFVRRAHEKLTIEIEPSNPNRATVVAGAANWPLPIPLLLKNGEWRFDPAEGRVAILARRIGRNELTAIDVCRAYVEAQTEYATRDRLSSGTLEYAQNINSSPGKKDGLYWQGEPDTLVPKAFADAAAALAESRTPVPYHGYRFRILKAQGPDARGGALNYIVKGRMIGGFALVAFPAEYGVSGVKTFIVNHDGIVYQKDLGPDTGTLARQMTRFDPDKTWKPVQGE
jgi:hypothetical protein